MKKLLLICGLLISAVVFSQPPNYLNIKSRYRLMDVMADSSLTAARYNGTPSGLRVGSSTNAGHLAVDTVNHRVYFYSNSVWNRLGNYSEIPDTSNKWVNTIYRIAGKDSIFFQIGSTVYAILDSTGGSSYTFTTPLVESGGTVSLNGLSGYGSSGDLIRSTGSALEYFTPSYITSSSVLFPTTGTGTATGNVTGNLGGHDFLITNTADKNIKFQSGGSYDNYIELVNPGDGRMYIHSDDEFYMQGAGVYFSNGSSSGGRIGLFEDSDLGSDFTAFTVGNMTSSVTYTLPTADGTSGYVLSTNGSGVLSWVAQSGGGGITIGTTTITSGTNTKVLYNNSGVVGEYTISGTGNVAMTTSPTFTTPNIGAASGTSVTLSSLTSGRVALVGTSGLITDASTILYNGSNELLTGGVSDGGSYTLQGVGVYSARSDGGITYLATDLRAGGESIAFIPGTAGGIFCYTSSGYFGISGESSIGSFGSGSNNFILIPAGTSHTHIGSFSYTQSDIGAQLNVVPASSSTKGVIVRGAASQSANLIEWQSSTPATLGYVDAAGAVNAIYKPLTSFTTSASSLTPNFTTYEGYGYTALAANLTINAPTGTPANGQTWWIYIKDDGTSRTLSWNAAFVESGITLPASTTAGKAARYGGYYANSVYYATSVEPQN